MPRMPLRPGPSGLAGDASTAKLVSSWIASCWGGLRSKDGMMA